ncbi:hypothetical protein H072_5417 [Dactylellina haptotyla CBS 200.50]|uniref:non-specific serine/threonine protein kinase n=1 Tax=Dactylellina haptotyla (strain CBS 200.50) TaxID=1284197 RepID=S8AHR3_DACHA|nr:hypothetical protein H072_5417 [Dactylellina haptotyla CBS 200.50]
MAADVGTPYQFDHVTHVGFDHQTGGFVGLPPEWEAVLRGEITAEEVNRRNHPPNYQRQNRGSPTRRKKQSCFMSFLGRCFGQSNHDLDHRQIAPVRIVSSSRLVENSDRSSSVPPPYDSVKSYDEVEQRPVDSPRRSTPPTQ